MAETKNRIYGIDLGTTYSSIAFVDEFGKAVIIPNGLKLVKGANLPVVILNIPGH